MSHLQTLFLDLRHFESRTRAIRFQGNNELQKHPVSTPSFRLLTSRFYPSRSDDQFFGLNSQSLSDFKVFEYLSSQHSHSNLAGIVLRGCTTIRSKLKIPGSVTYTEVPVESLDWLSLFEHWPHYVFLESEPCSSANLAVCAPPTVTMWMGLSSQSLSNLNNSD